MPESILAKRSAQVGCGMALLLVLVVVYLLMRR